MTGAPLGLHHLPSSQQVPSFMGVYREVHGIDPLCANANLMRS